MILYEFPFNESLRTMLRLEQLLDRLDILASRQDAIDHHFALLTMFEVMDVASRADLKSDLLRELEKHKQQLNGFRGNPAIAESTLNSIIEKIDDAHHGLNQVQGKLGQGLSNNEWLMSIRSRINIPGGTCEFDLPAYYAWQHGSASARQHDLHTWIGTFNPLSQALRLMLGIYREAGHPKMVVAHGGQYQQSLPSNRSYQLLRLRLDEASGLVPEISGHRLMVTIRLMTVEASGKLKPHPEDASFELTLS